MKRSPGKRKKALKFNNPQHDRLLKLFYAGVHLRIRAREFFHGYGISETQFNVLALIYDQAEEGGGLSQVDLSRMLLVDRSNITSDEQFALDLLRQEKVLVVQGTGFNWPKPDHFRVVFLPRLEDLKESLDRIEHFLSAYTQ